MNDATRRPSQDISARWYQYATNCNAISGYTQTEEADRERTALENDWRRECPGLKIPSVAWSSDSGRFELTGLAVPK
jgi:hypothetical protein